MPPFAVTLRQAVAFPCGPFRAHPPLRPLFQERKQNPASRPLHMGWARGMAVPNPATISFPADSGGRTRNIIKSAFHSAMGSATCGVRHSAAIVSGAIGKGATRMRFASGQPLCDGVEMDQGVSLRKSRTRAGGGLDGGGERSHNSVDPTTQRRQREPPVMGSLHDPQQNGRGEGNGDVGINNKSTERPLPLKQHQSLKLLTLPTVLTLGRVAAVPLLVSTFYLDSQWATTATTGIFIAAAITDWLDGYIARKMRLGTAFGAFLDPVADKLMVAATLALLCTKQLEVAAFDRVPWVLTVPSIAIIGREITMSSLREWAASQNSGLLEAVAVNKLGKWKTATQMTALTILLATRDARLVGAGFLVPSGVVLLYIAAVLAIWSLAVYMRKIWGILSM